MHDLTYTNIYISAHVKDIDHVTNLVKHLKQLNQTYPIKIYSQQEISVGENINHTISKFIKVSKIIICLLSVDYTTSCAQEIEGIFDYEPDEKIIIPIILKDCRIKGTQFEHYKPLDYREFEEKGEDYFWNHAIELIEEIYKDKVISGENIFSEQLLPKAFAGNSIGSDLKLITLNADLKNKDKIDSESSDIGVLKIRVIGESMAPAVNNKDIVLCERLETKTNVFSPTERLSFPNLEKDKLYVIETRYDGVMIKKIQTYKSNLLLKSTNTLFDTVIVPKEEVLSIWKVKSLIRNYE